MLFWIALAVLIIGIVIAVIGGVKWCDGAMFGGLILSIIDGIIVIVMLIAIIVSHCGIDAQVKSWKETYNALTYKLESGACRDEFGLLSKEIIDEVQNWNEDVIYNQNIQRDFWVGIFFPNVFDELETIDYQRYQK